MSNMALKLPADGEASSWSLLPSSALALNVLLKRKIASSFINLNIALFLFYKKSAMLSSDVKLFHAAGLPLYPLKISANL